MRSRRGLPFAAAAAILVLTSCAANELGLTSDSDLAGVAVGGGASSQQAAQETWVAGFQSANPDVSVEYDPAGSGAGRDMFMAGGTVFAGSDRPFDLEELATGEFKACTPGSRIVELPAYLSPIAVVFNLEGIDSLNLDPATIARIFAQDITRWDDAAIADQNPGIDLPDAAITAIHRSDDSGVTENFTDYLAATASEEWPHEPSGVWPTSGGEAAQGTSGIVDSVRRGVGVIGYVDASRATGLGIVNVKVGEEYVPYSAKAAAAIVDHSPIAEGRSPVDLAIDIDRTSTEQGVYPIVLISYLIGCEDYADDAQAELVREYFAYVISDEAQRLAADYAGSAPISADLQDRAAAAVALIE